MVAAEWRVLPVLLCGLWGAATPDAHAKPGRDTKPTLLRFASLKRHKTNVRVGPGTQYPIRWFYQQRFT
jgi:SH3-like domain-containing protein